MTKISLEDWQAEALARFGKDPDLWEFQCPSCFLAQTMADFHSLGMSPKQARHIVGFSCIRRWTDQKCLATGVGETYLEITPGEIRPTFHWAS
jgi:hypothetical protein